MKKRMKRAVLSAMALSLLLAGCGDVNEPDADTAGKTEEAAAQETAENPQETAENAQETAGDTQTPDAGSTSETAGGEQDSGAADDNSDVPAQEQAILEKGTLLFSGKTDEGYYPGNDTDWLKNAQDSDILAIVFACDDLSHGGWGVLGLACDVEGGGSKQIDIPAYADMPDKERVITYTMAELAEEMGAGSVADLKSIFLGAWNGGRIAGLYYLDGDAAVEMTEYLAAQEEAMQIKHDYDGSLSNPNAIDSAVSVYDYLKESWGKVCLTGQMESTWMGSPDYEMNYIEENTGKLPAIRGLDFMHNDFDGVVERSKAWWEKGGIVTICWHTGAGFDSGYNESLDDNINWDEAFTEGSATYEALLAGMDRAVPYLQQLEDAGVPVLWRPFHELDGGWFWWSKGGSENFVKLWQMMYDHYTNDCGLDNLIWVYGYSSNGVEMRAWYPGDAYVDLVGADSYTKGANGDLYDKVEEIAAEGMPIVFHECGAIPTQAELEAADADWLFFMTWHTDYITDKKYNTADGISGIYNSDYFITLDELPEF